MRGVCLREALDDSGFEGREVGVIGGITLLFDELPHPLNQVEVRGIGRQKTQLDLSAGGEGHHLGTALRARIVQDHSQGNAEGERSELAQEGTDLRGRNVGVVRDRPQFMGEGIQGPQHLEPLASGRGAEENPRHGPEEPPAGS
jgi:hypothetical protein